MKQKPRWTLEMLTASLAVLCGLLVLVLLIQRPTAWPALLALVVLWGVVVVLFRCQLRKWVARWMCGGSFEGSKLQFSLEPLSQPAALLSGETVLWYNAQFRTRLLNGQDALVNRVQKVLPGLDLQQCRKQEGQLLTLADGMWSVHSSTVPGDAESMTLLVLNEETALRKVEAEYKASRPGYLVFLVDGYDDVFGDMLDSERARLLEGINRTLEDMIGRGSGFAPCGQRPLYRCGGRAPDGAVRQPGLRCAGQDPCAGPQREPFAVHRHWPRGQDPAGSPGYGRAGAGYGAGPRRRSGR